MTEWREFRPKQVLLNSKFDGYRLTLDPLAQYALKFDENICAQNDLELNDDLYTYNGIKAFKSNNHLYTNPWNEYELYFIDRTHAIRRITIPLDGSLAHLQQPIDVYQLSRDCLYGSLVFISDSIVLVSDGRSKLFVLNTTTNSKWTLLHEEDLEEFSSSPFRLLHGITHESNLHGLIGFVEQKKAESGVAETQCQLIWLTFSMTLSGEKKQTIQLIRRRILHGKKWPDFVAIESSAQALFLAAEGWYKFTFDSLMPIQSVQTPILEKIESSLRYTWSQTHATVEITIDTVITEKSQWNVTIESNHLKCSLADDLLIDATLFDSIETKDSTFSTTSDKLSIVLQKTKIGSFWNELFKDGRTIEGDIQIIEIKNTEDDDNDDDELKQPYNSQQLEECDQYTNENDAFLFRFHGDNHQITHQALIYNQILFTKMNPPSLCLRHDVDGLIWEIHSITSNDQAPWTHEATLNAFGYVQASKQNRKFISVPSNFSYVLIADSNTHLYLYKQNSTASSLPGASLRNRKTGQLVESIAKQYMISLENRDEILGLVTTNERLFILTEHQLFIVSIE